MTRSPIPRAQEGSVVRLTKETLPVQERSDRAISAIVALEQRSPLGGYLTIIPRTRRDYFSLIKCAIHGVSYYVQGNTLEG
jgi:hypothetical protein